MAFSTLFCNYAVLLRSSKQQVDIAVVTNLIAAAVKILKVPFFFSLLLSSLE